MASRLLSIDNREPNPEVILDPSSAQFQLWLAQAQRDHNNISDREMSSMEKAAKPLASKSITIFNPFTGEIRKITT